jgi:hypothetical protein
MSWGKLGTDGIKIRGNRTEGPIRLKGLVLMFDSTQFPGDAFEDVWVPTPSKMQQEIYNHLYRLCYSANHFEGPFLELRVS